MYVQPPIGIMKNSYQIPPQRFNYANARFWPPFNHQRQNYFNRSPTSNTEHWCETCDRGFPTNDLLDKHLQQHQKCNIDGCQFVAHPKVVTKHIQMQHASGLYKKISKLNNPEDIEKWREERKKKYPTKLNIEKKAAELKEKLERGEKMGLKSKGHKKKIDAVAAKRRSEVKGDFPSKRQKPNAKKNFTVIHHTNMSLPKKLHNGLTAVNSLGKLKPFAGIQGMIMRYAEEEEIGEIETDLDIEDEDDIKLPNLTVELDKSEPKVCGALSSLMCDYESSEEESSEETIKKQQDVNLFKINNGLPKFNSQIQSQNFTTNHIIEGIYKSNDDETDKPKVLKALSEQKNEVQTGTCMDKSNSVEQLENTEFIKSNDTENKVQLNKSMGESGDESGPEEIKIIKPNLIETVKKENEMSMDKSKETNKKSHSGSFKYKKCNRKPNLRVPSTLLRKLLHREIQQERNIVLQCIRYVMDNNFLDTKGIDH